MLSINHRLDEWIIKHAHVDKSGAVVALLLQTVSQKKEIHDQVPS